MFSEQENLPPENDDSQENTPDQENGEELVPKRKKVRIKVRKKIRIKKKPSAKKMIRKIAERVFWTVIIVGFIASLIIMVVQLDVRDEKYKQQKGKATRSKTR